MFDGVLYFPTQHMILGSGIKALAEWRATFVVDRINVSSGSSRTFVRLSERAPEEIKGRAGIRLVQ
jgi:hypothetical protein